MTDYIIPARHTDSIPSMTQRVTPDSLVFRFRLDASWFNLLRFMTYDRINEGLPVDNSTHKICGYKDTYGGLTYLFTSNSIRLGLRPFTPDGGHTYLWKPVCYMHLNGKIIYPAISTDKGCHLEYNEDYECRIQLDEQGKWMMMLIRLSNNEWWTYNSGMAIPLKRMPILSGPYAEVKSYDGLGKEGVPCDVKTSIEIITA